MSADDIRRVLRPTPGVQPNAPSAIAVLFVDPDLTGTQRLADAIKDHYVTHIVSTARMAWATLQRSLPVVVVTELDLPDVSGLELIRIIHTTPATRHVISMVTTARTDIRDKVAAFQAGADDFLVKPIDPLQFQTHLQLVARFRRVLGS